MTKMRKTDYELIAGAIGSANRSGTDIGLTIPERSAYLTGIRFATISISKVLEKADPKFDAEKFKIASSGI